MFVGYWEYRRVRGEYLLGDVGSSSKATDYGPYNSDLCAKVGSIYSPIGKCVSESTETSKLYLMITLSAQAENPSNGGSAARAKIQYLPETAVISRQVNFIIHPNATL